MSNARGGDWLYCINRCVGWILPIRFAYADPPLCRWKGPRRPPVAYAAINTSNDAGESTVLIESMLSAIKASLMDAINASNEVSDRSMDKETIR